MNAGAFFLSLSVGSLSPPFWPFTVWLLRSSLSVSQFVHIWAVSWGFQWWHCSENRVPVFTDRESFPNLKLLISNVHISELLLWCCTSKQGARRCFVNVLPPLHSLSPWFIETVSPWSPGQLWANDSLLLSSYYCDIRPGLPHWAPKLLSSHRTLHMENFTLSPRDEVQPENNSALKRL